MNLKGIKNIIFDLGNVIIDIDHNNVELAFQNLLGDVYSKMKEQLKTNSFPDNFEIAKISTKEFISFFQSYNSSLSDIEIKNAWNSMLLDIPKERITLINKLTKKYRVFLLSNTNEIHLDFINQYVAANFGLSSMSAPFEKAYYSHLLKLRKPKKAIFEEVLRDSKLIPQETLFIDDTEEHVFTAKQLNLKTHHLLSDETILDIFNED